ncbi:spire type actin nucleation factor isoform X3 [Osmia lignaria lignaria]|uniref:spire type actin nucleation factor isoform X3 n=1 Tax=Osmia lignaria lignaria TaxID=1437193 RepID=UPI00402BCBD6
MTTNKEISTSYKDSLAVSDDEKKTITSEKKEEKSTNRPKCRLDANGRLNLKDILISFNGPVSQEQAWALCYQTAKSFSRLPDNNFYELLELSQIVLHKDGDVWLGNLIESRQPRVTEQKAMFSLGMMIFKALDFGLDDQEERPLSPDLEALITLMTRPDQECGETEERPQETDDEGIERDSSDADVDEYLSQKSNDTYEERPLMYSLKNVMHARFWVQVIQELRKGVKLKKVEANLGSSKNTSRGRGKGAEFELTPYEILMDDIRERRYRLRKTPSPTPHLRKDAHAVILEFIRSRPPLKKASERQLPPLQKEWTLRELLMESIKKPPNLRSSRNRYVPKNERTSPQSDYIQSTGAKENESPTGPKPPRREVDHSNSSTSRRKIIPVDFDLKLDAEDEDDDEDYNDELAVTRFEEEDETSHYWQLKEDYSFVDRGSARHRHKDHRDDDEAGSANPWRKTGGLRLTRNEYHRFCDAQLESYDLATQCPSRRASARKHAARRSIALTALTGTTSLPHSRPQSRQHIGVTESTVSQGPSPNISLNPSPSLSPQPRARQPRRSQTIAEGTKDSEDQNEDWQDDKGQKPTLGDMFLDERLSLTLEEIVHIRSVLTKAELESLPVEGRVKEDVEKRRVCFLCLKTRFGLLGPWGQRCRLCERTVCVKCYSKMRIPTEHFAHVPVVLLSPGLLLSPSSSEPDTSKSSWLRGNGAAGSAPASPASRRKDSSLKSATPSSTPTTTPVLILTPTSTPPSHARREMENQEKRSYKGSGSPANVSSPKAFSGFTHQTTEQRLAAERLRGVSMVVCHDCRIMVIQIIKSSRTTRATIRNNVISRLTLNLSPAYV